MKTTKTKEETKRSYYTPNAFEGVKYNPELSTKEIAKRIKKEFNKRYPKVKVSITSKYYSGGSSINIHLMKAPFEAFKEPNAEEIPHHDKRVRGEEQLIKNWKRYKEDGHKQINHHHLDNDYLLTKEAKEVLKTLTDLATCYNYDDSDAQRDYFDTNFYLHMRVGKYDRPFENTSK